MLIAAAHGLRSSGPNRLTASAGVVGAVVDRISVANAEAPAFGQGFSHNY